MLLFCLQFCLFLFFVFSFFVNMWVFNNLSNRYIVAFFFPVFHRRCYTTASSRRSGNDDGVLYHDLVVVFDKLLCDICDDGVGMAFRVREQHIQITVTLTRQLAERVKTRLERHRLAVNLHREINRRRLIGHFSASEEIRTRLIGDERFYTRYIFYAGYVRHFETVSLYNRRCRRFDSDDAVFYIVVRYLYLLARH